METLPRCWGCSLEKHVFQSGLCLICTMGKDEVSHYLDYLEEFQAYIDEL